MKLGKYDHEKLKKQMVERRSVVSAKEKTVKKKSAGDNCGYREDQISRQLRIEKVVFSIGKTLPVRIQGIVINYRLLSPLMKKLKGESVKFSIRDGYISVDYGKGYAQLYDISEYFQGFEEIPQLYLPEMDV